MAVPCVMRSNFSVSLKLYVKTSKQNRAKKTTRQLQYAFERGESAPLQVPHLFLSILFPWGHLSIHGRLGKWHGTCQMRGGPASAVKSLTAASQERSWASEVWGVRDREQEAAVGTGGSSGESRLRDSRFNLRSTKTPVHLWAEAGHTLPFCTVQPVWTGTKGSSPQGLWLRTRPSPGADSH